MAQFEAKIRLRVLQITDDTPVDYLTRYCSDAELGVLVLDVSDIEAKGADGLYEATVHVRVRQPPKYRNVTPHDYLNIHMTDDDFGLGAIQVDVIPELN